VRGTLDWQIGVDELLVAALAMTLADSTGSQQQRVFLEGHGRESDEAALDVTRTIGWFTSLYPVLIEVGDRVEPASVARRVRDQLRRVSSAGREYGILRYLHPDLEVRQMLTLADRDHVVFNYLGRITTDEAEGDFALAGPVELSRPEGAMPPFGDEVSAVLDSGRLVVTWTSASRDASAVSDAVDRLLGHLESMVDGLAAGSTANTADGEFPLANLDSPGLDKLAAVLRAGDDNQ
jgi:microcystin synthetase protein McyA